MGALPAEILVTSASAPDDKGQQSPLTPRIKNRYQLDPNSPWDSTGVTSHKKGAGSSSALV